MCSILGAKIAYVAINYDLAAVKNFSFPARVRLNSWNILFYFSFIFFSKISSVSLHSRLCIPEPVQNTFRLLINLKGVSFLLVKANVEPYDILCDFEWSNLFIVR